MNFLLILGIRSLLLKSFSAAELTLPESFHAYTIEKRRSYFHLFFLPLFGLGTFWALRTQENKLLKAPADLTSLLKEKNPPHPSRKFIANVGGIFILTIGLLFIGYSAYSYYQYLEFQRNWFEQKTDRRVAKLNDPKKNDFYSFYSPEYGTVCYRIDSVKTEALLLRSSSDSMVTSGSKYSDFDTIRSGAAAWVSKDEISRTIRKDFNMYTDADPYGNAYFEIIHFLHLTPGFDSYSDPSQPIKGIHPDSRFELKSISRGNDYY